MSTESAYHGHRDRQRPFSLVIRDGAGGSIREALEIILAAVSPYRSLRDANAAKDGIREDLRPFVIVHQYRGRS